MQITEVSHAIAEVHRELTGASMSPEQAPPGLVVLAQRGLETGVFKLHAMPADARPAALYCLLALVALSNAENFEARSYVISVLRMAAETIAEGR
jgi:hypothetical protein